MALKDVFKRNHLEVIPIAEQLDLDDQQKEAVVTTASNVLVVAGAGSGKTRVLTERIKYLISKGVDPSGIVAITLTNMASDEMKLRLKTVPKSGDAFIGTIHSFANRIMQLTGKNYTIYSSEIEIQFCKDLIQRYCKHLTFKKYIKYVDLRNAYEAGLVYKEQVVNFLSPSEQAELRFISGDPLLTKYNPELNARDYPETIKTLRQKNNVITFDQLLKMATEYFNTTNSKITHLMVDEFQDIGTLEYDFFESLNPENRYYVGDDFQSIYGFKGGNVNIMLSLSQQEDFKVINLTKNYRNAPEILNIANLVISQVDGKIDKEVIAMSKEKGDVYIDTKSNILTYLNAIKEENRYNEWFILVRTNDDILKMQDYLDDLNIPNHTFKREGLSLDTLNKIMKYNSVKILTVHTSKGLENKSVLLWGNFPLKQNPNLVNQEERKVMYVGITRAKEQLVILN